MPISHTNLQSDYQYRIVTVGHRALTKKEAFDRLGLKVILAKHYGAEFALRIGDMLEIVAVSKDDQVYLRILKAAIGNPFVVSFQTLLEEYTWENGRPAGILDEKVVLYEEGKTQVIGEM